MTEKYDVLIVGGGMVGATVACALGNSSLSVILIEQTAPNAFSAEQIHDMRVSALSIASQQILQTIGAWDAIIKMRSCAFKRMRVWETAGDTEFNSTAVDYNQLGYIVENRVTQLALLERTKDFSNVTLLCPTKIKSLQYQEGNTTIDLEDGTQLSAKVTVGADGGQSRLREAASIGITSKDYQQHALVVNIETDYVQQDITWQRFVSTGPQAFLPLSGNHASIVWYNTPEAVKRLKALSHDALLTEMTQIFPDCLGKITNILGVASFPLKRQHAQAYVKQGLALVGDAAHMINPLAGQGVNIGLLDAACLAEVLLDAHKAEKDIADIHVLKRYECLRRPENLKMMMIMDLFYSAFSNKNLPLKILRNLGLGLAERVTPLKNKIMRGAMGLEGKLPKLAKNERIL
jgi:2-octaprenyl-3-methyl-6-methoxy-1,4-benzoquinol hydroxylase